jgi:hypothetical protein
MEFLHLDLVQEEELHHQELAQEEEQEVLGQGLLVPGLVPEVRRHQ